MDGAAIIQPFGFDRVFFHPADMPAHDPTPLPAEPPPRETTVADLREELAEMEARIERLQADHRAELARARADGFEAGASQARAERGEALLAATDALHGALDAIEARFDTMARTMVGEAGAVALHAAELLAGHAVDTAPTRAVSEALARVLDQVAQGTALVMRVNPSMREEIAVLIDAREAKAGRPLSITVVDDVEVPDGDARIEWSAGGLNIDAEARRAAVMSELAGVLI